MVELGARSLKNVVTRQVKQKLAYVFLAQEVQIHDGMNKKPLEACEVRLISTGGDEHEVMVNRAGVRVIPEVHG